MKTDLSAAMAAGVLVEFFDIDGHCIGQAVFADWFGKPVPAVGDQLVCPVGTAAASNAKGTSRKLSGRVRVRHVDIQRDEQGRPCVWVRVEVDAARLESTTRRRNARAESSAAKNSRSDERAESTRSEPGRAEGRADAKEESPRRPLFDIWFSQN